MKKVLIILMLLCTVITVSAKTPLVVDNADLLSADEEKILTNRLESMRDFLDIDVVVLTENSLGGKSPRAYADDYYDQHGYAADGVLLLLDMGTHNWWVSTSGSCIAAVDADLLGEYFVPSISEGEYYQGVTLFAKLVQATMERPENILGYNVDKYGNVEAQYPETHWYDGLWQCLLIGVIAGGIAVAVMAARMKSVRPKGSAADYVKEGSLELAVKEDLYLYQRVSKRARPKNNSGTHRASSGRSHGGGGGRF